MDVFNVDEDDKDEIVSVFGLLMLVKVVMFVLSYGKEFVELVYDENGRYV